MNILERPVYRRHNDKCAGNLRMTKKGINGNSWEFRCDECQAGLTVMDSSSLPEAEKIIFSKFCDYIKRFEK